MRKVDKNSKILLNLERKYSFHTSIFEPIKYALLDCIDSTDLLIIEEN